MEIVIEKSKSYYLNTYNCQILQIAQ